MTSPELEAVLAHLRQLGDRIMSAINDLAQIRALIDDYADVHPSTGQVDARVTAIQVHGVPCEWVVADNSDPQSRVLTSLNVVNSQHRQQFQICRPIFQGPT